jgi:hypothetical protein
MAGYVSLLQLPPGYRMVTASVDFFRDFLVFLFCTDGSTGRAPGCCVSAAMGSYPLWPLAVK